MKTMFALMLVAAVAPLGAQVKATAIPMTRIGGAPASSDPAAAATAAKPDTAKKFVPPTTPPRVAMEVFQTALKKAGESDKGVFIRFSASWCGWCHKLDAFLKTPEGLEFEKYVVLDQLIVLENGEMKVLENKGSDSLFKAWGGGAGIPYYAFFDAKGNKLSDANGMPNKSNIGYPANAGEDAAFAEVIKTGMPRMPDSVRTRIMDYLAKHP